MALRIAAVALALGLAAEARARDLFEIFVMATDGSGTPDLLVGGSSFVDLVNSLINSQGAFASFDGVAFEASVNFAGVPNAITITGDPAAQQATLTFSILGDDAQTFVFTGDDLFQQIQQFLQDNLAQQITAFIDQINTLSLVAVTDGTPLSSTALSASYVFDRFGLHADLTAAEKRAQEGEEAGGGETGFRGRVDTYGQFIGTDVGDGVSVAVAPSFEYVFDERISLALLLPITYLEIEGAQVFNLQANIAMPINLLLSDESHPLGVRVTPFGTFAASASVDLLAGGLIAGGGVLGTVTLELGDFTISASSQLSFHDSITLRYDQYEFDPGVSQQILKNGLKVTHYVGDDLYLYGTITETMFLSEAAVDEYLSPGAGIGYRTGNGLNLNVGYSGDIADGYHAHQVRVTIQLPF